MKEVENVCHECGNDSKTNKPIHPFAHHHHCSFHPRSIEARRHAILQAAAIRHNWHGDIVLAVNETLNILAEIERCEKSNV